MISEPTVLILGAGASIPYGFPDGWTLKNDICDKILGGGSTPLKEAFSQIFFKMNVLPFARLLQFSAELSIDAFLERRPEFEDVGKKAIAGELIQYERLEYLLPRNKDGKWTQWGWYHHLFNRLTMEATPDTFDQNKLAVITFNYDRSLEEFLFRALHITFSTTDEEALKLLRSIPIIHVHGMLAPYDPLGTGSGRPYRTNINKYDISQAAESIRIVSNDNEERFVEARELMKGTERICFLGFGYHPDNCRRLGIGPKRTVFGTVYGLTRLEFGTKVRRFFQRHTSEGQFENPLKPVNQCINMDYLRHYFSL